MKRPLPLLLLVSALLPPAARAQSPAEMQQTARYLAAFQNKDGGFASVPGGTSSLGATSSAVRTLKYLGGSIPDVPACIAYVKSCWDKESGGFAPTPGGKPGGPAVTASGLMALAEFKIEEGAMIDGAVDYLSKNAKTFEEVRIAVAGLEAVKKKSPEFPNWIKLVNSDRNEDGTWGKDGGMARATGSATVALLRMGMELDKKDAIFAALKKAQLPDGGWSRDGTTSDLESTYRVMRGFFMAKEKPDLERLQSLIARCRQSDGAYASAPGKNDGGGTYFCTIVGRWAKLLGNEPAIVETAGFQQLFDGKTLDGWEGDTMLWSARDGMIVGQSPGLKHNDFLSTTKSYGDFILRLTFRVTGDDSANSGVQFRSVRVPGHEMSGYQADIGQGYWGCLYDESRRNKVLVQASDAAKARINKGGWNTYTIRAVGDRITLMLNGVPSVNYREEGKDIAREGKIALQIHAGNALKVEFKDIYIQELPIPTADEPMRPGFHTRTLKTDGGERKYVVFVPEGYDGSKSFPVVLFLHGAGERGQDGVSQSRVGIGAAIANRPANYPFLAVFPQARQNWQAGSEDSKAALAALNEVMKDYKVDANRVILTGLSLGGAGSWSNAAAAPERFSAVAPVCGFGDPNAIVDKVKGLPIWTFLGDDDSPRIVSGTRAIAEGLKAAGAAVKSTEYRGVGHNSWDRAYNDPMLIDWMLSQTRKAKN